MDSRTSLVRRLLKVIISKLVRVTHPFSFCINKWKYIFPSLPSLELSTELVIKFSEHPPLQVLSPPTPINSNCSASSHNSTCPFNMTHNQPPLRYIQDVRHKMWTETWRFRYDKSFLFTFHMCFYTSIII